MEPNHVCVPLGVKCECDTRVFTSGDIIVIGRPNTATVHYICLCVRWQGESR